MLYILVSYHHFPYIYYLPTALGIFSEDKSRAISLTPDTAVQHIDHSQLLQSDGRDMGRARRFIHYNSSYT